MEDLETNNSHAHKQPVDLLVGGEGRENSRNAGVDVRNRI